MIRPLLINTNEQEVQTAMENILTDRTSITIAHKLKTIQFCDQIFVFSGGMIAESGNHVDLMKLGVLK